MNPVHTCCYVIALLLFIGSTCKLIFRIVEVQYQRISFFENYIRIDEMLHLTLIHSFDISVNQQWFAKFIFENTAEVYRNIRSHISQGKNS